MKIFSLAFFRTPIKSVLLFLITISICFAFVFRVSNYLLVKKEIQRLTEYYQAIGVLHSGWQDNKEVISYLSKQNNVQTVNEYHYIPGIIQDGFCNADTDNSAPGYGGFLVTFYATFKNWDGERFYFLTEDVLVGRPEILMSGQIAAMTFDGMSSYPVTYEDISSHLEQGSRYLVRGMFFPNDPRCIVKNGTTSMFFSDLSNCFTEVSEEDSKLKWYELSYEERMGYESLRSLNLIATTDMTILPETQQEAPNIYLVDGRWLDLNDNISSRKVCVINSGFATLRNLEVGDTITIKLKDIPSYFGTFYPINTTDFDIERNAEIQTDVYTIVGIFEYLKPYTYTMLRNNAYIPRSAIPNSFTNYDYNLLDQEIYERLAQIITSNLMVPPGEISFSLTDPNAELFFMLNTYNDLEQMGYEIEFLENNWDDFQMAIRPIESSSALNAVFFTGALIITLSLLTFFYYLSQRRNIAIARALGVSVKRCVLEVSIPMLLTGSLGACIGGYLAWYHMLEDAEKTLNVFSSFQKGTVAILSNWILVIQLIIILFFLLLVDICFSMSLAHHSILTLLQNGTTMKRPSAVLIEHSASYSSPYITELPHIQQLKTQSSRHIGIKHIGEFVWQAISRSKIKTVITILLTIAFSICIVSVPITIIGSQEEIDFLLKNTKVEAELFPLDTTQKTWGSGFIRQDTVDMLLESGFVLDIYLEGYAWGGIISYTPELDNLNSYIHEEKVTRKPILSFADEARFLSSAGSGEFVTITYLDNQDGTLFNLDWEESGFPVVVPESIYREFGSEIYLYYKGIKMCKVAGYYNGIVPGNVDDAEPILVPLNGYQTMSNERNVYCKAHVTLNPNLNQNLAQFQDLLNASSINQGGMVALRSVIWDEELRLAVTPLKKSVELMTVIYPMIWVLSLLISAGVALLLALASAKEVALMRVLGTPKFCSHIMVTLQIFFTSSFGLFLSWAMTLVCIGKTRPDLLKYALESLSMYIAIYLLIVVVASGIGTLFVMSKKPLELLQVKE